MDLLSSGSIILVVAVTLSCNKPIKQMNPPIAEKIKKELINLGDTRIDYYYWLNQRENQKVIKYLKDENAYTGEILEDVNDLRQHLFNEIVGRIKQTDESVPYKFRGYYYYSRFETGKEYPVYCRKKDSLDNAEEIILNVNELAKDHNYCNVASLEISPDNHLLAYTVDTFSRRMYTLQIKDLRTGKTYQDAIPNTSGSIAWANDNQTLFYLLKNTETLRPEKVMRHVLGTPETADKLIFHETDETFYPDVFKTKSEKYIIISSSSTISDECRFLDADHPDGEFKIIQPRERNHEYSVEHMGDHFYILTNLQAKNFRLMKTPVNKTGKENWKEVIPYRPDVLLDGLDIFKDYMVLHECKDATPQLQIIRWADKKEHHISFDEEVYTADAGYNPDFESNIFRFNYSSLTTPNSVFDYNMATKERKLMKRQEVIGDFDPARYESKRLFAIASDGTRIPVSVVYKKGVKSDGTNPLLLYGYGSYGISMETSFRSERLSLLDRGFVYAIAHIRGGQEMGRQWYEDGKLLKKKNTFTDFIACAELLIKEKYTTREKLFALGGSAGGLLMGAVTNMRPDLFKGIIAAVPFVDVVTTMLDESIPLTTGEYDEWGNPNEKTYYDYIKSYSPYDNVEAKAYPNILVLTGLHDSQVQYWEPAKWVAKLRVAKTDRNLLLLHTNMDAGHGGASGRFERYKETALVYAFLFKLLGIKNKT
jgi:oligopeptidase B